MKKSVFFSIATNIFQCWIFPWHLRFARCLDRRRLGPRNFWVKIEGPCVFCMNIFWWFGTWLLYGFYDFPSIGNGKSSQLTNSYFSDWNHQPVLIHFVILFRSQFRNICVLWVDLQEGISTATGFSKKGSFDVADVPRLEGQCYTWDTATQILIWKCPQNYGALQHQFTCSISVRKMHDFGVATLQEGPAVVAWFITPSNYM